MKKVQKHTRRGTVLFTTVSVMALLIIFLWGTLTLATASNSRAHKSYSTSQATYTARSAIDGFVAAMERDEAIAAAVENVAAHGSAGSVIYPEINIADKTLGRLGYYDNSGNWVPDHIVVENVASDVYQYLDDENRTLEDPTNFNSAKAKWHKLDRVKISATVRVGTEEETVSAYIQKRKSNRIAIGGGTPQVKGIQLVGNAGFPTGKNVSGGLGVNLGEVAPTAPMAADNPMNIVTELSFFNTSLIWRGSPLKLFVRKPQVISNGNVTDGNTPYSQTIINGSLYIRNTDFVKLDYTPPSNVSSWTNKEIPYVYVDGLVTNANSTFFMVQDVRGNQPPFNFICGTIHTKGQPSMDSTDLYLMDTPSNDEYEISDGYGDNVKVKKGNNQLGNPTAGGTKLNKWAYSVANGTYVNANDIGGNVYCMGNLTLGACEIGGDVRVEGNVTASQSNDVTIHGRLIVGGYITDTNGKIHADGGIFELRRGTPPAGTNPTGGVAAKDVDPFNQAGAGGIQEDPSLTPDHPDIVVENHFVPEGKVDPSSLHDITPAAYERLYYFQWIPFDHLNSDSQAVDPFGNVIDDNPSAPRYYEWNSNYTYGCFDMDILNNIGSRTYEDLMSDANFLVLQSYLRNDVSYTELDRPENDFDHSVEYYYGVPVGNSVDAIVPNGNRASGDEKYYFYEDEGNVITETEIEARDVMPAHYVRVLPNGTKSGEILGENDRYTMYKEGIDDDSHRELLETYDPAVTTTTDPSSTTTTTTTTVTSSATVTTQATIQGLPADISSIYPANMTRDKIYGWTDTSGEFMINPDTKFVTNLTEARQSLGLNTDGSVNQNNYPTSFPSAPTTKAYTNGAKTPGIWTGDVITASCVLDGSLNGGELHIKPNGSAMYIVLDGLQMQNGAQIIVDTTGPSDGVVYFIVKNTLFISNGAIRPSTYTENCSFDYTKDWGVVFYGTETPPSKIQLQNNCVLVGSFKMPATYLDAPVQGKWTVNYTDTTGTTEQRKPTIVGNALFSDMHAQNDFDNCYTASGQGGTGVPAPTTFKTELGYWDILYMLGD